jgi:hypothetical protein
MSNEQQDVPHDPLPVVGPNCGAVVPPPKEPAALVGYHYCAACRLAFREAPATPT